MEERRVCGIGQIARGTCNTCTWHTVNASRLVADKCTRVSSVYVYIILLQYYIYTRPPYPHSNPTNLPHLLTRSFPIPLHLYILYLHLSHISMYIFSSLFLLYSMYIAATGRVCSNFTNVKCNIRVYMYDDIRVYQTYFNHAPVYHW